MTIQRAIMLVNLALIATGTYLFAGLCYQIAGAQFQLPEDRHPVQAGSERVAKDGKGSLDAYSPILQRDLFKTRQAPLKPVVETSVNLENMEATKLNLKLLGTVTGDSPLSYAVIEDTQKKEQNLYRVGDGVQNATLKLILRSSVVLTINGKDEILEMEQSAMASPGDAPREKRSRATESGSVRTQKITLRRSMIDEAFENVGKLMTEIHISPHMEDGVANGLSLSQIKSASIFRRMGLRNGDVLKSIDGKQIDTVDDALQLYENLKSSSNVSVLVTRRGRDRNISYTIE